MEENVYNDSFVKLVKDRSIYSNKPILTPNDTAMVVADLISDYDREAIVVASFDSQNKPININIVGLGTINSAMMHPRELFKAVLLSNSASIMVFHNHPSGDPTPSQEDIKVTNNLRKICNIMDINFLDHMVIGNDKIFSINENKVMDLGQEKLNYDLPEKESSFSLDLVSTRRIKDKEYYNNNISINSPEVAATLVADLSVDYKNDALTIAYVDNKLKPIKLSLVDNKLLESKQSYLKHIARNAILSNASSMIIFTSHFDGSIMPNLRDNIVSQNNKELGKLINIDTVDHIIIGSNTYYSMKSNMELPKNNWNNVRETRENYKTSALTKILDSRKELVEKIIDNLKNKQYIIDPSIYKHLTSPYNPTSEVRYSGANRFKLMFEAIAQDYKDSRWCTYKQAQEQGWNIKRGAKGVLCEKIIFSEEKIIKDEKTGKPILDESGKAKKEILELNPPKINYFYVFNAQQIENIPELKTKNTLTHDENIKLAEKFIETSECPIVEKVSNTAYYSLANDEIVLPLRQTFSSEEHFLSTTLHEMAHSTGHPDRLNRLSNDNQLGTEGYALEELNAELASIFIRSDLGIDLDASAMYKHNVGYISSWINKLSNDPNVFFRACSEANKISKYLVENYEKVQVQIKQIEQSKPIPSNNSDISNKLLDEVKKNGFKCSDKLIDAINKLSSNSEIKPTLKVLSKEYKKLSKDLKAGVLDKTNMTEHQKNIKDIGDILKDQEISKQQQQQKVNTNVLER